MPAPQQGPCKEFAVGYRDLLLQNQSNELQTTKRVISAIPENKKDHRPDPKARTAWELAWHIASVDVQVAEEIAEGKFNMDPRYKNEPKTVAELASWYEQNLDRALDKLRAMTPEQSVHQLHFYG